MANPARRFATTRWSLVRAAGQGDEHARRALAELCELYWYPLYAFVRRDRERTHEEAEDLTQGFITDILARDDLSRITRTEARFRSWLLQSLRHHLARNAHHQNAQKRGGGRARAEDAERYRHEPSAIDAERLFHRRWAMTAIESALAEVRAEVAAGGPQAAAEFDALKGWLVGDPPDGGYEELAKKLGTTSVALRARVSRWRRVVRASIADTLGVDENVDAEIEQLIDALS